MPRTCAKCPSSIRHDSMTGLCGGCYTASRDEKSNAKTVVEDRQLQSLKVSIADLRRKYGVALKTIETLEAGSQVLAQMREGLDSTVTIEPRHGSGTSEATPVIVGSDWHAEEIVTPAQVNGLNEFNPEIAERRIARFFQASHNLIKNHLNPGVQIHDVVLALLGDFITNDIHEELVENVAMRPTEAIIWVQSRIVAGLEFLLNHTAYTYTIVCRVGNHSRTTHKTHFSQENGHSLEHLLYVYLAGYFRAEPRIRFVIQDGYHIYLKVQSKVLRFHHGHAIKYGGGIGGITIPTMKAIAAWDKARPADVDVFGHFHQSMGNRKFKCNGSLVGYNSFGVQIKGEYEPPQQTLFLVDKKRGLTCEWPIIL